MKTDIQLLQELQTECSKLGRMLKGKEIDSNKNLSSYSCYRDRFGGIKKVSELIEITNKKEVLLHLLKIESDKLGRMLTREEIDKNENLSCFATYYKYIGCLSTIASKLNLELTHVSIGISKDRINKILQRKTDEQLLKEFQVESDKIGRMLTKEEVDNNKNIPCYTTYRTRFGGLKNVAEILSIPYLSLYASVSVWEIEMREFISSITNKAVLYNDRKIIEPFELDIYIPELNIAIECNGEYWHSKDKKDREYHINKTKGCDERNITLLHIWDTEWKYNQDEIKKYIKETIQGVCNKAIPNNEGLVIVDRMKPIKHSNTNILEYTEPKIIKVDMYECWDCGEIIHEII